jgi:hypothetical protein
MRVTLLFTLFSSLFVVACQDDFEQPCSLPQTSEVEAACSSIVDEMGNTSVATCVDRANPECQSLLCVSFEGSEPFCSLDCDSDEDCPSLATCHQLESGNSSFCLPARLSDN